MFKLRSFVVLGLVAFAGKTASGQHGQVVSYYTCIQAGNKGYVEVDSNVGGGGFVITDVIVNRPEAFAVVISTSQSDVGTLTSMWMGNRRHSLQAGLSVSPNSGLFVRPDGVPFTVCVTLSGYIPSPTSLGNVPAVGSWGLTVMVLTILVVGSTLLRKRRMAT